jgi:hypothetical protein
LRDTPPLARVAEVQVDTNRVNLANHAYVLWVLLNPGRYDHVYPYSILESGASGEVRHVALGAVTGNDVGHTFKVEVCRVHGDALSRSSMFVNALSSGASAPGTLMQSGLDLTDYASDIECYSDARLSLTRGR